MTAYNKPNKLISEKSPYLLQHAYNPVDWHPWGDEAFNKAKTENKPIFLSIGYSTCHWCHVMERESFENIKTARIMNEYFVNIKLDREERPDIDRIYMAAVQAISGSGGWPMSVFLDHELTPFFGGTYFPPEPMYGRPSFTQVLEHIHRTWINEHDKIASSAQSISNYLHQVTAPAANNANVGQHTIALARNYFIDSYDGMYGGFGDAPKFPRPSVFNFLLANYKQIHDEQAKDISLHTLREMARHGMYDHVGGGFHRYSVDRQWRVSHFEKMLYDQAQLVNSYIDAYLITKDKFYYDIVKETLSYVQRDMTSPEGGFYSAEDADSLPTISHGEKVEGAFYVWEKSEIDRILGDNDSEIFCFVYGIKDNGNALSDPQNEFVNKNILYSANSIEKAAGEFDKSVDIVNEIIKNSLKKLYDTRKSRPRPHLDDKVITAWNGLMVSAFARAYQVFEDRSYLSSAIIAANFILSKLINSDGDLYRRYRDGEARFAGTLDDYAYMITGLIDLYEASFDPYYIEKALDLQEKQMILFWDYEGKGFYETTDNDSSVIVRMKDYYDGAEPCGNSISLHNLLRLSNIIDRPSFYKKAEELITAFSSRMDRAPQVMPQMLSAFLYMLNEPKQVIVAGDADNPDTQVMLREIRHIYNPFKTIILADDINQKTLSGKLGILNDITKREDKVTVYICENNTCREPVSDVGEVRKILS